MKAFIFISLFSFSCALAFAQANSDSLSYQIQRKKINAMLARRAEKFGQYDESLKMHTGIFGVQTKNDIRRSNDILMDIVKTDNAIYRELKILLEDRAFQQTRVQTRSKEMDDSKVGYISTINKLRRQTAQLKADVEEQQQECQSTKNKFIIALAVMSLIILVLLLRRRRRRA